MTWLSPSHLFYLCIYFTNAFNLGKKLNVRASLQNFFQMTHYFFLLKWYSIQGTEAARCTQLVAHSANHVLYIASWPYSPRVKTSCSICDMFCHTLANVPKVESSWDQSSFKFSTASDLNKLQKTQRTVNYYRCVFRLRDILADMLLRPPQ